MCPFDLRYFLHLFFSYIISLKYTSTLYFARGRHGRDRMVVGFTITCAITTNIVSSNPLRSRGGPDRMVVGFTTTYTISAYHHSSCEFESHSWQVVLTTTLCHKVCQWLATGWWFSLGTPVSSTIKTDCHDITEISLKVALNTITITLTPT
jgi:hypothetical protein